MHFFRISRLMCKSLRLPIVTAGQIRRLPSAANDPRTAPNYLPPKTSILAFALREDVPCEVVAGPAMHRTVRSEWLSYHKLVINTIFIAYTESVTSPLSLTAVVLDNHLDAIRIPIVTC